MAEIDAVSWLQHKKQDAVLIVLNQKITELALFDRAWDACARRVVTDGAANRLRELGNDKYVPDLVVGDFDSAHPDSLAHYEKLGVPVVHDPDQYSTDFMKAMNQSHRRFGAGKLNFYAFNALGGRIDHCWHSYLCLSLAAQKGDFLALISNENVTFFVPEGAHTLATPRAVLDECCGYAPIEGESSVTTRGLEWDVQDYAVSFATRLSTSNHLQADEVYVETDKPLMFTVNIKPL